MSCLVISRGDDGGSRSSSDKQPRIIFSVLNRQQPLVTVVVITAAKEEVRGSKA